MSHLVALLFGLGRAGNVTEFVAVQPNSYGPETTLSWVRVDYPSNVTSAMDVQFSTPGKEAQEMLGSWLDMDMGSEMQLTGKIWGDKLYGYMMTGAIDSKNVSGGCCADTIRIWDKEGDYNDIDLMAPLEAAFNETTYDYATHTFDLTMVNDDLVALCMVQYEEPALNNARVDAIVAISMTTGKVVPTADGLTYFALYDNIGTTSTTPADSVYKIYYEPLPVSALTNGTVSGGSEALEEFHGNGVLQFTTADGTEILAITQKVLCQAVLMYDPWTYKSANQDNPGGAIVQRFGTPTYGKVKHTFGLEQGFVGYQNGIHNVFYAKAPDGRESVTIFVNGQVDSDQSWIYEFDLNLVKETDVEELVDEVFETTYRASATGFLTGEQGGARPIGHTQGSAVWLTSSGRVGLKGLVAVDESGANANFQDEDYPYYDCFIFLRADSKGRLHAAPW